MSCQSCSISMACGVQVLKVLEGHTHNVLGVAISTDGAKIVSGSWDKTVRVWSMETGQVPTCVIT